MACVQALLLCYSKTWAALHCLSAYRHALLCWQTILAELLMCLLLTHLSCCTHMTKIPGEV